MRDKFDSNTLYYKGIYQAILKTSYDLSDLMVQLQLHEFVAMIFVIKTQQDRTPEVIYTDHKLERLDAKKNELMP